MTRPMGKAAAQRLSVVESYTPHVKRLLDKVDEIALDLVAERDLKPLVQAARRVAAEHFYGPDVEADLFLAGLLAAEIHVGAAIRTPSLTNADKRRLQGLADAMASPLLSVRLDAVRAAEPVVLDLQTRARAMGSELDGALGTMMVALINAWGSPENLTLIGEIVWATYGTDKSVSPDHRDLASAWLNIIGPAFLQLSKAASGAAKYLTTRMHAEGMPKAQIARWLGVSRPTLDRWIAEQDQP